MKSIALIFSLIVFYSVSYAENKTIENTIEAVTVYTNGAQIEREGYYYVGKGTHTLFFESISPNIDRRTIQVEGTGSIIIMDAQYESYYPESKSTPVSNIPKNLLNKIQNVEDSIVLINNELARIQMEKSVYESEKNIILNNGMMKGNGKVNDSIQLLRDALLLYHDKMMVINKNLFELDLKNQKWSKLHKYKSERLKQLQLVSGQYQPQAQNATPKHRIKVTVIAKESAAKGKIYLKYIVSGASWTPGYDLRASGNGSKVNFTHKAWIQQSTGNDWNGASLTLSTHDPYANKQLPNLTPWFLEQNNYYRQQRETRDLYDDKRRNYPATNKGGVARTESADEMAPAEYASSYTQRTDQLVSAEYKINLPYDIPTGGTSHLVLIDETELPGDFKYIGVPKASNSIFAVTTITDFEKLQLIPGQMQIFYDGAFIGEQYLNPSHLNDTLKLTLGADRFLYAERNAVKVETKKKIIGNNVEVTYAYEFMVKNQKSETVEIEIQDQIPVTRKEKIDIEIEEQSKGELNKENGIITWKLKLRPNESEKFEFSYKVKYPKEEYVNLPPA